MKSRLSPFPALARVPALALSLALILFSIALSLPAFAAQPNIILLMGDDHGWEETGYNGHPHVKTPVLDEMAATGLRFENFYAAHPTCSPTRASFLTGRHPNRMGTFTPGWSIRPEEITSADILHKAGYRCGHYGKWHLGAVKAASPVNPGAMGFDEWLSHDNFFEMNPSLSRNGAAPQVFKGESSAVVIDEAIRFIDDTQQSGKPFFTVVWFGSPHEPYSGLAEDLALYDDLPAKYPDKMVKLTSNETGQQVKRPQGEVLRERYAEITAMDRAIGTLRDHLADTGLRNDTLLFYCGDNGTSRDGSLVLPHRGVKAEVYDGGILVPGLIEWPAQIKQARSVNVRASTSDLLPTLCALTGQPLPDRPLDGIDLSPWIKGKGETAPGERSNPLFFWQFNTRSKGIAGAEPYIDPKLQEGTTPLVKFSGGKATRDFNSIQFTSIDESNTTGPRAIIDADWKLVIHELKNGKVREELFDLKSDPAETTDLIQTHAENAKTLRSKLSEWQQSVLNSLTGADYAE